MKIWNYIFILLVLLAFDAKADPSNYFFEQPFSDSLSVATMVGEADVPIGTVEGYIKFMGIVMSYDIPAGTDTIYFDDAKTVWIKFDGERFVFSHPVSAELTVIDKGIEFMGTWVDGSGRNFDMEEIVIRSELEQYCICPKDGTLTLNDSDIGWDFLFFTH